METIEYRDVVDKSVWGNGPWADEPDKLQWQDDETGLPCLIVRNPVGSLCGYVGVPLGHPWHGLDNDDDELVDVEVHGGLTFSGACQEGDDSARRICHIPSPGEADDVWWLGFDCAHAGDISPSVERPPRFLEVSGGFHETYKSLDYVRAECASLARYIAAAA